MIVPFPFRLTNCKYNKDKYTLLQFDLQIHKNHFYTEHNVNKIMVEWNSEIRYDSIELFYNLGDMPAYTP